MSAYDGMTKTDLQDLARSRELPVSGTVDELVTRLEQADADALLGPEQPDPGPNADGGVLTESSHVERIPTAQPVEPAPQVLHFEKAFPCRPSELSTGLHQSFMQQTYQAAVDAGHEIRGGLNAAYGAHRTGFQMIDGQEHAVYQISVRRK